MDALRKNATKFKTQIVGPGYQRSDATVIDEAEFQRHKQLENLYSSTRSARDFQKDVVRAAEGIILVGNKHIEVGMKLSEDCFNYARQNNSNDSMLAKAASLYGSALRNIEKEYEDFNRHLSTQFMEPLRAMSISVPLEDARSLAQRYSRMRHEAQNLVQDVFKRKSRVSESPIMENTSKLQYSEEKLQDHKASMAVLGKEAAAALSAVESQQQRLTLQRFISLVEEEKSFHLRIASILDDLESEIVTEKQTKDSAPPSIPSLKASRNSKYFLAEALYNFIGTSQNELSLMQGDYVVVRQVTPAGWAEGECQGKAGWFPAAYVERCQNIPPNYTN